MTGNTAKKPDFCLNPKRTDFEDEARLLAYHDLIASIVAAMEARDGYTASHSMRVAELAQQLCGYLCLSSRECTVIHIAAHLHDIGKIGIDDATLRKQGPLNEAEWAEIRRHPAVGSEILGKLAQFAAIAAIVRHHHERWDGRGYPDGVAGTEIPLGARIIAVADSIDAMMSSRSYRAGLTSGQCREEIRRNAGVMYDPAVAEAALCHWTELVESRSEYLSGGVGSAAV